MKKYVGIVYSLLVICICHISLHAQTWTPVGNIGFLRGEEWTASLAINNSGIPYVIGADSVTGAMTVMKYQDTCWVVVGSSGFSAGVVSYGSIAIDSSGTPYVAYMDWAYNGQATVMRYNGSAWENVGIPGFTTGRAWYIMLAVDRSGTPYIVYQDQEAPVTAGATVMKYDGTNWVTVGVPGFSTSEADYASIAIDRTGTPYVAYRDDGDGKATVMKYDGSSWVAVGSAAFSADGAQDETIAFDTAGHPYVAFTNDDLEGAITVMKYNDTDWVNVGMPGFSASDAFNPTLAIDVSGTPYVVYGDAGDTSILGAANVLKFDGTNWVNAGNADFSATYAQYTMIAIDGSGAPYVAYRGDWGDLTVEKLATPILPINGENKICIGSTATLHDNTPGGSWSSSNTAIATIGSATGIVTGIAAGIDTVIYTVYDSVVYLTVTVDTIPQAGTIDGVAAVCVGSIATFVDAAVDGMWSISNASATVSDGIVTGVTPGTDTLTYEVINGCGIASATKVVAVEQMPSAGTITGGTTVCTGDTVLLTDDVTGGLWTSSNATATVSGSIVTGMAAGVDTIIYSVSNSCGTVAATHAIIINPLPVSGIITGPDTVCKGDTIMLTDTAADGTWTSNNTKALISPIGSGVVVMGLSSGTDVISYTASNGCGTALATHTVTIATLPAAGAITGVDSICEGSAVTLSDIVTGGMWSSGNTTVATISGAGETTALSPGSTVISYAVTNSCGTVDASFTLYVPGECNTSVDNVAMLTDLVVYPNPTSGTFTIYISSAIDKALPVVITNMLGEKIKEFSVLTNKKTEIHIDTAPGVYFLETNDIGDRHTIKLFITK